MMAEGRLLRVTILASAALHVVVLVLLAQRGLGQPIALDDLRVVSVGTYTPAPPRPELSLPKSMERRPPTPKHPRQPQPGAFHPRPRPVAPVPPQHSESPRPVRPRPIARTLPSVTPPTPPPTLPTTAAPRPAPPAPTPVRPPEPRPEPTRLAQAPPRPTLPTTVTPAASGNSGGRLNIGSASAAGTVPAAGGGGTPAGHVPNEGTGGSGSGSGDVPRGRGGAEPTPEPVRPTDPGPALPAPRRDPDPPPPPRMVTVSICRKSGLLAGRHCAEFGGPVVERSFVVGQQPDDHCTLCKPPPPRSDLDHNNRSLEARKAELIKDADPDVPEELADVHGTVTIRYWVDERGRVVEPSVVASSGSKALDECAKRAVKKFKYRPAEQGGARRIQAERTFRF
jgi:TonB family protein